MDSTSAASWYNCLSFLENFLYLDEVKDGFETIDRLSMSDGDASIERAERTLFIKTAVPQMRICCVMHKICGSRRSCCDITAWVKTFLLAIIKVGVFKLFRLACVRVFIRKAARGVCRDSLPSQAQRAKNEEFLRMFTNPRLQSHLVASATLCTIMPGDHSITDRIFVYPKPEESDSKHIRRAAKKFAQVALGQKPEYFPGVKFQKVREPVDFLGRLAIHGILLDGFKEFMILIQSDDKTLRRVSQEVQLLLDGTEQEAVAVPIMDVIDVAVDNSGSAACPGPGIPDTAHNGREYTEDQRREHAQHRSTTKRNLERLGHDGVKAGLMLLNVVMIPHVELMEDNFTRTGEKWENRQRAAEIRCEHSCIPKGIPPRRYRLEEAFEGT